MASIRTTYGKLYSASKTMQFCFLTDLTSSGESVSLHVGCKRPARPDRDALLRIELCPHSPSLALLACVSEISTASPLGAAHQSDLPLSATPATANKTAGRIGSRRRRKASRVHASSIPSPPSSGRWRDALKLFYRQLSGRNLIPGRRSHDRRCSTRIPGGKPVVSQWQAICSPLTARHTYGPHGR